MDTEFEQSFWICSDFFGIAEHIGISRRHEQEKFIIQNDAPKSPFVVTVLNLAHMDSAWELLYH